MILNEERVHKHKNVINVMFNRWTPVSKNSLEFTIGFSVE